MTRTPSHIRITVAEPSAILRYGLLAILKRLNLPNTEVFEVEDVEQLRSSLGWQKPDILIINPTVSGITSLAQLRKDDGELKIAALCPVPSDNPALRHYDESISLYDSPETVREKIVALAGRPVRDARRASLSNREKQIVTCIIHGMTNKQIAEKLCLSVHTVVTHRRNISSKLGIHSTAGLTIYAIVNKLVDLDSVK